MLLAPEKRKYISVLNVGNFHAPRLIDPDLKKRWVLMNLRMREIGPENTMKKQKTFAGINYGLVS